MAGSHQNGDLCAIRFDDFCVTNTDVSGANSSWASDGEEITAKRRRVENHAHRYLKGQPLMMESASLKGPFDGGWKNPWITQADDCFRYPGPTETIKLRSGKQLEQPLRSGRWRKTTTTDALTGHAELRATLKRLPYWQQSSDPAARKAWLSRRDDRASTPSPPEVDRASFSPCTRASVRHLEGGRTKRGPAARSDRNRRLGTPPPLYAPSWSPITPKSASRASKTRHGSLSGAIINFASSEGRATKFQVTQRSDTPFEDYIEDQEQYSTARTHVFATAVEKDGSSETPSKKRFKVSDRVVPRSQMSQTALFDVKASKQPPNRHSGALFSPFFHERVPKQLDNVRSTIQKPRVDRRTLRSHNATGMKELDLVPASEYYQSCSDSVTLEPISAQDQRWFCPIPSCVLSTKSCASKPTVLRHIRRYHDSKLKISMNLPYHGSSLAPRQSSNLMKSISVKAGGAQESVSDLAQFHHEALEQRTDNWSLQPANESATLRDTLSLPEHQDSKAYSPLTDDLSTQSAILRAQQALLKEFISPLENRNCSLESFAPSSPNNSRVHSKITPFSHFRSSPITKTTNRTMVSTSTQDLAMAAAALAFSTDNQKTKKKRRMAPSSLSKNKTRFPKSASFPNWLVFKAPADPHATEKKDPVMASPLAPLTRPLPLSASEPNKQANPFCPSLRKLVPSNAGESSSRRNYSTPLPVMNLLGSASFTSEEENLEIGQDQPSIQPAQHMFGDTAESLELDVDAVLNEAHEFLQVW